MPNQTVITNIARNLIAEVVYTNYYVECAEGCWTICISKDEPYRIKAKSAKKAAKKLYKKGWRNIDYEGYESFACPECMKYIQQNLDLYPQFKAEEMINN